MSRYRNGVDLILGVVQESTFKPLGYSSGCKISDKTETGERATKETTARLWKEKYAKSLAETITADGFVYDTVGASKIGFPDLKTLWLSASVIKLRYKYRDDDGTAYEGDFIINGLDHDGPADDDEKWSVTFENSGAVAPVSAGGGGGGG